MGRVRYLTENFLPKRRWIESERDRKSKLSLLQFSILASSEGITLVLCSLEMKCVRISLASTMNGSGLKGQEMRGWTREPSTFIYAI